MAAAGEDPFEEVPVLSCPACRAEIPADSAFCPLCGARVAQRVAAAEIDDPADPTEVTEAPEPQPELVPELELIARRTLILDATPPPVLEDRPPPGWSPHGPGPGPLPPPPFTPGPGHIPPGAFAPPGAPPPGPGHMAFAPPGAPPPGPGHMAFAPPGAPRGIPITPSPLRIVLGAVLACVGLWLAAWFVPHAGSEAEVHVAGNLIAAALGIGGLGLIVAGALHRAQAEVLCRSCSRPVIAWKGAFGLHCPLGPHYARVNWLLVVVTVVFWTGFASVAIATAVWLL